jgi:hypothetical protein
MQLAHYLGLLHRSQLALSAALDEVADHHGDEPDVRHECHLFASRAEAHAAELAPFVQRYGEQADEEPERLHGDLFGGARHGGLGLLRDLHDLYLMATEADISWTLIGQAAQGVRDSDLLDVVLRCEDDTSVLLRWLKTRMKQAAPQALVVS